MTPALADPEVRDGDALVGPGLGEGVVVRVFMSSDVVAVSFALVESKRQETRTGCKPLSFTVRYAFVGRTVLEKPRAILESPVERIAEGELRISPLRSKVNSFRVGSKVQMEIVILAKKQNVASRNY